MFRKYRVSGSCLWQQKAQPGYSGAGRRITAQKPTNRKTSGASDAPPGTRRLLRRRPSLITEHGPHVDAGISVSFIRAENRSQEVWSVFRNTSLGSAAKAAIPASARSGVGCVPLGSAGPRSAGRGARWAPGSPCSLASSSLCRAPYSRKFPPRADGRWVLFWERGCPSLAWRPSSQLIGTAP